MPELVNRFVFFIENYLLGLAAALAALMLIAALILLIVLIRRKPEALVIQLRHDVLALESKHGQIESAVKDEIRRNREETRDSARQARDELGATLRSSSESLQQRVVASIRMQRDQLDSFAKQLIAMARLNEHKLEAMRRTMEIQLRALQEDNTRQLENMRATVDEKLQTTLEKRLGESFKQVSERLEQVYKGLGEMRSLATGVGDLKKVLTNVKTRGTWGEIRLSHILEQILTRDQYEVNVATRKDSNDRVEFAVKLPGPEPNKDQVVWLPIDAKFPQEDYQRLVDAQEAADKELADKSVKSLENRIKLEARNIKDKYIDPPHTTDFAIMFLPVEGLYAEVLRQPGLCDTLQREHRIVVTGPTTLAALLNSLQMGFRTLAIEKRSSEVWELLGAVKAEFSRFVDVLALTKKKLQEASNTIGKAEVRTRVIERRLRAVQEIPQGDAMGLIEEDQGMDKELNRGSGKQAKRLIRRKGQSGRR
jgi:DNA recombination protein RmuC